MKCMRNQKSWAPYHAELEYDIIERQNVSKRLKNY